MSAYRFPSIRIKRNIRNSFNQVVQLSSSPIDIRINSNKKQGFQSAWFEDFNMKQIYNKNDSSSSKSPHNSSNIKIDIEMYKANYILKDKNCNKDFKQINKSSQTSYENDAIDLLRSNNFVGCASDQNFQYNPDEFTLFQAEEGDKHLKRKNYKSVIIETNQLKTICEEKSPIITNSRKQSLNSSISSVIEENMSHSFRYNDRNGVKNKSLISPRNIRDHIEYEKELQIKKINRNLEKAGLNQLFTKRRTQRNNNIAINELNISNETDLPSPHKSDNSYHEIIDDASKYAQQVIDMHSDDKLNQTNKSQINKSASQESKRKGKTNYKERHKVIKDFKIKESEIPMQLLYNEGFEHLKRFDNSKNKVKIKPVVVKYYPNYSKILPDMNLISMQVMETGEISDIVKYNNK